MKKRGSPILHELNFLKPSFDAHFNFTYIRISRDKKEEEAIISSTDRLLHDDITGLYKILYIRA